MDPENLEGLVATLSEERRIILEKSLDDMETLLNSGEDPQAILNRLRKADSGMMGALLTSPLQEMQPFSYIRDQISELGIISRTASVPMEGEVLEVQLPPKFNKDILLRAIQEAKVMLK